MTPSLYLQNKIAAIWDFDQTLIPGHMQKPIFDRFHVDERKFWDEANNYKDYFKERGLELKSDTNYLLHMLTYTQLGIFNGLNNKLLYELGAELNLYPGLPEFFELLKARIKEEPRFRQHDIEVEHYVVSSGLRQMILGSAIGNHLTGVWACEFVEQLPYPGYLDGKGAPSGWSDGSEHVIKAVGYQIDNTTKTRAVFEINKGCNFHNIDVNDMVPYESRRIPFENMVYIADGKSDVPVFSLLNQYSGRTFAVYEPGKIGGFQEANELQQQGRVNSIGPADYSEGTQANFWISDAVWQIAEQIIRNRTEALNQGIGRAPAYPATHTRTEAPAASTQLELEIGSGQPVAPEPVGNSKPPDEIPLFKLPLLTPKHEDNTDPPPELTDACQLIPDTYRPISDDEMRQMAVIVRSRSGARSPAGRRRGSARDVLAITVDEVIEMLDQIRAATSQ